MLEIIASNFLKIGNGWAIVEKYATSVVYVGTHFFCPFPRKLIVMHIVPQFSRKKTHLLNGKGIDDSKVNMSGINDDRQNYEICECKSGIVIGA